jgi:hypothetical protein
MVERQPVRLVGLDDPCLPAQVVGIQPCTVHILTSPIDQFCAVLLLMIRLDMKVSIYSKERTMRQFMPVQYFN